MKICYLADATNFHTNKWFNFFLKKGYEISIISLQPGEVEGAEVYAFNESGFDERSSISKLGYFKHAKKVRKLVNEIKPDILHAHYCTSYGMLGALSRFHPYVISVYGSDIYDFPQGGPFHSYLVRQNLKTADMILSTSKDMARESHKYTDKDIKITPFGVDVDIFKPMEVEKKADYTMGTVKMLAPKYGLTYMIEAFSVFKKRHPEGDFALEIAGKGPQEKELKELTKELGLEDSVYFLGFVDQYEVAQVFNRLDVALFPSVLNSESFGVAAVEAQACGTPVIASNVGGLPEATNPGVTSLLVEPRRVDSLVEAMDQLYLDRKKREDMAKACRPFVLENYNIEDNFQYVDQLYHEIYEEFYGNKE